MLLMNVHPKVVSERLGHSDIRITLQLYSHAIPTLQTEAANKIDELLSFGMIDTAQSTKSLANFEKVLDVPSVGGGFHRPPQIRAPSAGLEPAT